MEEINADPDLTLRLVIADMVERHYLRGQISIAGRYSCEYCVAKGDTGKGMRWPYPKYHGAELRLHEELEDIAR